MNILAILVLKDGVLQQAFIDEKHRGGHVSIPTILPILSTKIEPPSFYRNYRTFVWRCSIRNNHHPINGYILFDVFEEV